MLISFHNSPWSMSSYQQGKLFATSWAAIVETMRARRIFREIVPRIQYLHVWRALKHSIIIWSHYDVYIKKLCVSWLFVNVVIMIVTLREHIELSQTGNGHFARIANQTTIKFYVEESNHSPCLQHWIKYVQLTFAKMHSSDMQNGQIGSFARDNSYIICSLCKVSIFFAKDRIDQTVGTCASVRPSL